MNSDSIKTLLSLPCLLAAVGFALMAGCDDEEEDRPPLLPPDQRGEFAAGTELVEVPSSSGFDMTVQLWYPAAPPEEGTPTALYDGLIQSEAYDDLDAACDEVRPVALFSHGSGGIRWQSTYLAEHLASRGFIVAAPDHKDNTFGDDDEEERPAVTLRRPQDIIDVFEWLLAQSAESGNHLSGCIDPDAGFAVLGHSFGGYTTLALAGATIRRDEVSDRCDAGDALPCAFLEHLDEVGIEGDVIEVGDDRVWAGVAIAPWDAGVLGVGLADINVPVLVIGASEDQTTPMSGMVEPIYESLTTTPRALAEIADSAHSSFIGICNFVPGREGCSEEYRDPAEVNALTETLAAGFLDLAAGDDRALSYLPPDDSGVTWQLVE